MNNDPKLNKEKLKMWTEKLSALEKEYASVMQQRGELAEMGDLSENATYEMLTEQGEVLAARISETKNIIRDLGGNPDIPKPAPQDN